MGNLKTKVIGNTLKSEVGLFPDVLLISPQQQNIWPVLRPCFAFFVVFVCFFICMKVTYKRSNEWNACLKKKSDSNMVMMSWRHGVRLSWVLFVTAVAWNPSLLNTVTFDPFTLPSLPVDRRVLSSTVNPNVSFPTNDVVVNIRPLLIAQASSKGGRLDPTCAKKNKTKHVKTEKGWTDGSSAFSQFVCLLLFSRRKKRGEHYGEKKYVWTHFPVETVVRETWSRRVCQALT